MHMHMYIGWWHSGNNIHIQIQSAHVLNHRDNPQKKHFCWSMSIYITMCDHKFSSVKIKNKIKISKNNRVATCTHTLLFFYHELKQKNNNDDTWNQFYCRIYVKCAKQPFFAVLVFNNLIIQFSLKFVWPFEI